MLIWAFICLIITIIAGVICYKSKNPTVILITKFIFHFFLLLFFVFLIMALFSSLPLQTNDKKLLPI